MKRYVVGKINTLLGVDFFRFCLVGASGFLINLTLLTLFYKYLQLSAFSAQLIAAEIALFSNFLLHHTWTYKKKNVEKSLKRLIVEFHASSWPAIIGSTLLVGFFVEKVHMNTMIALILSSVTVLLWNFTWTKFVIWGNRSGAKSVNNTIRSTSRSGTIDL